MKWTTEQSYAIEAPVTNLLVSASAGSGKTAVMTDRIIKRVMDEDGCDIDKILVMTFTNAAASEIKERINAKIMKKLDDTPDDVHLKKQLALSANSHFCTIHSFCLDIIKSNFNTLGLDPAFRTGDTAEIELLKREAIDNVFENFYEKNDAGFLRFVSSYSKRTDSALLDVVIKIYDFSRTFSDPDKWLSDIYDNYKKGIVEPYTEVLLKKASFSVKKAISIYKKAISLCDLDSEGGEFAQFLCDEMQMAVEGYDSLKNWDSAYNFFSQLKFKKRDNKYIKNMDVDIADKTKNMRDDAKKLFGGVTNIIFLTLDDLRKSMRDASEYVDIVIRLVRAFSQEFSALKLKKNLVDYSDYEHLSLKCLMDKDGNRTDYAKTLSESFEEIYIDEYQDCNNVQEKIFQLVSRMDDGKNNIFMVGDAKQSIYRFRDADPSLFTSKQEFYEKYDPSSVADCSLITLNKNFRSRKEVLNAINHIFSCVMTEDAGEIRYTEDEYLYYNEDSPYTDDDYFKTVDIDIINYEKENFPESDEALTKESAEAIFIAKKIRSIVDSKTLVYDKNAGAREIRYSDIAVLMRSLKGHTQIYNDVFRMYGIPLFIDYNEGYLYSEEISSLISVIKVVLNPLDDIELVSVMRLIVFGFDENELLNIRMCDKDEFFYNALRLYESKYKDGLGAKIRAFLDVLDDLRQKSKLLATTDFINYLIDKINYREYVMSLPLPSQALANVNLFIKRAEEFGKTDFKGIFNFIHFINENLREKKDSPSASLIDESQNVVRLMSVHKSKGLEFPVVILCRCGGEFNSFDMRGSFLLHKKLGIGLKYSDINTHFSYPLITHTAIKERLNSESLSEEERVLYVALTRAREKLIITGCIPNAYKQLEKYNTEATEETPFSADMLLNAKTFFAWILPAVFSIEPDKPTYVGEYRLHNTAFKVNICDSHTIDVSDAFDSEKNSDILSVFKNADECDKDFAKCNFYNRFVYKYPGYDEDIPTAFTVTELKEYYNKLESDEEYSFMSMPSLKAKKSKESDSPLKKGTVTHLVLKFADFSKITSVSHIDELMDDMIQKGFIDEDDKKLVDKDSLFSFISGEKGREIAKSKSVYREFPFKILKSAKDVSEEFASSDETIVIQGAIDLFYENERGNYTLIDYKTDKSDDENLIRANYTNQILIYRDAIERITGKICDESYICLLKNGKLIKI